MQHVHVLMQQVHISVVGFLWRDACDTSQHYLGDRQHVPSPLFSSGAGQLLSHVLVTSKAELPELCVGGTWETAASCDTDCEQLRIAPLTSSCT